MLYALSYGTFLAQRFLQLFPGMLQAAVLDGYCALDLTSVLYYDMGVSSAGYEFMAKCADDATCRRELGEVPVQSLRSVMEMARADELRGCGASLQEWASQLELPALRSTFGQLIVSWQRRVLIGPLVQRILRCSDSDAAQLRFFFHALNSSALFEDEMQDQQRTQLRRVFGLGTGAAGPVNEAVHFNDILSFQIMMSELFFLPNSSAGRISAEAAEAQESVLDFGLQTPAERIRLLDETHWPTYVPDPTLRSYPNASTEKLLLITGTMDPQTPLSWLLHAKSHYRGRDHHFVALPGAVHGTAYGRGRSPVTAHDALDCGMQLVGSFLGSLGQDLNRACLSQLQSIDFSGLRRETQALSQRAFGTTELWNGVAAVAEGRCEKSWWQCHDLLLLALLSFLAAVLVLGASARHASKWCRRLPRFGAPPSGSDLLTTSLQHVCS